MPRTPGLTPDREREMVGQAMGTRCLVVDDHTVLREGLDILFGDADDLELVGNVETGEEAIDAAAELQPEVILMDVRLPGIDGVSAVKRIHQLSPNVQFVMFTAYGDKRLLSDAIAAGARGYVMKGSPPADLLRAIRTVADGKAFVDPSLSPALLMTDASPTDQPLSEREREILQLLAEGFHTEEVARRIGLSVETVKSDTKRVIGKLQADTRTHAVAIALRQAIIE
jgi:two-component system, NarL family, response regulator YdfI